MTQSTQPLGILPRGHMWAYSIPVHSSKSLRALTFTTYKDRSAARSAVRFIKLKCWTLELTLEERTSGAGLKDWYSEVCP